MRTFIITPESIYDSIRSVIINRINNETYNSYFPVIGGTDDEYKKNNKVKPLVILPSRKDEN